MTCIQKIVRLMKELEDSITDRKVYQVHGLGELILLK